MRVKLILVQVVSYFVLLTGCSTLVVDEDCHLNLEHVRNDSVGKFRLAEVTVEAEFLIQGREPEKKEIGSVAYRRMKNSLRILEEVVKGDLEMYAGHGDFPVNLKLVIRKRWQRASGTNGENLLDALGYLSLGVLPFRQEQPCLELAGRISGDGLCVDFADEFSCTKYWSTWSPLALLWGLSDKCLGMNASLDEDKHDVILNRELGYYVSEVTWAHLRTEMEGWTAMRNNKHTEGLR